MGKTLKSAFFIMQLWQTGNIGSYNIKKCEDNPKEGFKTYNEAKETMVRLSEEGNWTFTSMSYDFAIMEIFEYH